jgi:hypothetical protein
VVVVIVVNLKCCPSLFSSGQGAGKYVVVMLQKQQLIRTTASHKLLHLAVNGARVITNERVAV